MYVKASGGRGACGLPLGVIGLCLLLGLSTTQADEPLRDTLLADRAVGRLDERIPNKNAASEEKRTDEKMQSTKVATVRQTDETGRERSATQTLIEQKTRRVAAIRSQNR